MKIYLFLNNRLFCFTLPKDADGSFSFDENDEEESKLINIEAVRNSWFLYSTEDVQLIENGYSVGRLRLKSNTFYTLKRNEINYVVYVSDVANQIVQKYNYEKNFNLTIGKNNNCSIIINNPMARDICAKIFMSNGAISLEKLDPYVYVNNNAVSFKQQLIPIGSEINIYYLKLIILPNVLLVFGDETVIVSNISTSNLSEINIADESLSDDEIKDESLYNKNDYYFKSPRLRRFIETKKIKFSKPPVSGHNDELPLILTLGPIFTMGIVSFSTLARTLSRIALKESDISKEWPQLLMSGGMLVSMLVWPLITKWYNKRLKKKKRKALEQKYGNYLDERREELNEEVKYQSDVLKENLLSTAECLKVLSKHGYNFWDRRNDQDDFLHVRLGIGTEKLDVDINYSDDDFTVDEDDLKKQANKVVEDYEKIYNVPVKYSFYENKMTAIIGNSYKCHVFMNNLILQLLTFYTYEDIKFVVFTNNKNKDYWTYLKYTNHSFSNSKDIRFFSSDIDDAKMVSDYLMNIANYRTQVSKTDKPPTPYYIVIIDNYNMIKSFDFIKLITESEDDIGFSIVLLEDRLSELPSRCNNFISIGQNGKCEVIRNTSEKQEHLEFTEEILYNIDMMKVARNIANIPIEFEKEDAQLPNSLAYLAMEKIGKVEQLNILNRWNINDSTISLKSEVGVDSSGNLIYLDLHEKQHGPHGLIAGTTGSGKSEFIITYVLSLCVNFSPDIVSFVLIDYKGGGLALAFENRTTGVVLPHLSGTITNLDKAEMDRTLVSIDSEVKRRQKLFNEAREILGESTIDIYKYQRYYKEGRVSEPVTHLFIICDEFAELKSQQPEFMDNLISVARIGRSLGVHLILATQKPSGVVNDQIWSNSRFKVCLKVQDENDSKEMLKKPDAAYIKQAGRFYLQVGYDEYFILGQSGWTGAKYYPSDKPVKEIDKSINFISDSGRFIKSIKASSGKKIDAQGDQFNAVLKTIIDVSKKTNKYAKKLWLENINPDILLEDLDKKYNIEPTPFNVEAIIGEYDAPEIQYQDIVKFNFINDGNTIIYGNDGSENEFLLDTLIYSTSKYHDSSEVNFYILDYGSEMLRKYEKLPQVGGIVYASDEEKYKNLIKLIKNEIKRRKKIFADYGGEYKNYIKSNKIPLLVMIFNNYDSISESNKDFYDIFPDLVRDSERYGIVFVVTCSASNSVRGKVISNFHNFYAFKLKDKLDYSIIYGSKVAGMPRNIFGRGFIKHDKVHEFQVAHVIKEDDNSLDKINLFIENQIKSNSAKAKPIPVMPEKVRFDNIRDEINGINDVPVGISRDELDIETVDFVSDIGNIISANKISSTDIFVKSLITIFRNIKGLELFIIDSLNKLEVDKSYIPNYFVDDFETIIENINNYIQKLIDEKAQIFGTIIIYGFDKFKSKLESKDLLEKFINLLKKYEHISVIIIDDSIKIKSYSFDSWFKSIFNVNNGIWIGKGISDQNLFHLTSINREMMKEISNSMGYVVSESTPVLCKLLDFFTDDADQEE